MILQSFKRVDIDYQLIREIPEKPGIYRFLTETDKILYIGASSNIRKRILQHMANLNNNDNMYNAIKKYSTKLEYKCYNSVEKAFEKERIEIWVKQPPFNKRGVRIGSYSFLVIRKKPFQQAICYSDMEYDKIRKEDEFYRFNMSSIYLEKDLRSLRRFIPFCMPSNKNYCWDHLLGLCKNTCRKEKYSHNGSKEKVMHELIETVSNSNGTLIDKLELAMTADIENLRFEKAQKILRVLDTIKVLRSRFCGKGFDRETDEFLFNIENEPINRNQVKIISRVRNHTIWEQCELFDIPALSSLDYAITNFLFNFYSYSGSAPKRIEINFSLPSDLKKSFEKWLKRYYRRTIPLTFKK